MRLAVRTLAATEPHTERGARATRADQPGVDRRVVARPGGAAAPPPSSRAAAAGARVEAERKARRVATGAVCLECQHQRRAVAAVDVVGRVAGVAGARVSVRRALVHAVGQVVVEEEPPGEAAVTAPPASKVRTRTCDVDRAARIPARVDRRRSVPRRRRRSPGSRAGTSFPKRPRRTRRSTSPFGDARQMSTCAPLSTVRSRRSRP